MSDRSIKVVLRANVADFTAQMRSASTSLEDVAKKADKTGLVAQTHLGRLAQSAQLQRETWSTVSTGLTAVGAAGVAMVGVAVKKFADFDQAMSNVQAATHESAANMELLRSAAIDAGAETQYSATEAAGAIEALAKAGISTADVLSGGLSGALNLAAAGGMQVADAAEIAATALTQFGLSGGDVGHVADLLAAGAGKAQGNVSDLGMALKQGGLVASQTGLSIEETTGALAAFASAGMIGSDAGTSFKTMLQRLTPQSQQAKDLMDKLGISAYDAQGNFVGLSQFAGSLQNGLKGLTVEQRNAAMSIIFGQDAVRAANVLYEQGASGIQSWINNVDDSGYAAETAAARMDNLKGDIEKLSGSLETAFIQSGSGANDMLRGLVQGAESVVDAFNGMPDPVQQGVIAVAGFVSIGTLAAGVGMKAFTAVSDFKVAFDSLRGTSKIVDGLAASMSFLKSPASLLVGGGLLAAAGAGFAIIANNARNADLRVQDLAASLDQATGAFTANTRAKMAQQLQDKGLFTDAERYGISLRNLTDAAMGNSGAQAAVARQISEAENAMRSHNAEMGLGRTLTDEQRTSLGDFEVALRESGAELDSAQEKQRQMAAATGEATDATGEQQDATEGATGAVQQQTDALQELIKAQQEAAGIQLSLSDAQIAFQQSIDDATAAVEKNGKTLDINTQSGRDNRRALDEVAKSGLGVVQSMADAGASTEELQKATQQSRDAFIRAAVAMGASKAQAEALADKYNLIPRDVSTTIHLRDNASGQIVRIRQAIANVPSSKTITVYTRQVQLGRVGAGGTTATFASGGPVVGPGTGTSDSILSLLSNGEYVIRAAQAAKHRSLLDKINFGIDGYADGGPVGVPVPRFADGGVTGTLGSPRSAGSVVNTFNVTLDAHDLDGLRSVEQFMKRVGFESRMAGVV